MIIFDLDDVLADFRLGACRVHGHTLEESSDSWDFWEDWGCTTAQFWGPIHALGDRFYRDYVPPCPWFRELVELAGDDWLIMTAPGHGHPLDYSGKRVWVDKHIPGAELVVGHAKHLLAAPGRLLVDDKEENCDNFRKAARGAGALLFPQPWNWARNADRMVLCRDVFPYWVEREYACV